MASEQLTLVDASGLCDYGLPRLGEPRRCSRPATHAACWHVPAARPDGTPNPRAGSDRVECCESHAGYYAAAWQPPGEWANCVDRAWIEEL